MLVTSEMYEKFFPLCYNVYLVLSTVAVHCLLFQILCSAIFIHLVHAPSEDDLVFFLPYRYFYSALTFITCSIPTPNLDSFQNVNVLI